MSLDYKIIENYRDNSALRELFYDYVGTVFGPIDFKIWYDHGFWTKEYIPFSIVENDKMIANVSISEMDLFINGRKQKGIQFATVGTLPEYRNRGISRHLMEFVLNKYSNIVDFMFLFANDDVLDFYPKFGFERREMSVFNARLIGRPDREAYRMLDLQDKNGYGILKDSIAKRMPLTERFGAENYRFVTMWHVLNLYPDKLYYFEKKKAILIASVKDRDIHVWDIISANPIKPECLIAAVVDKADEYTVRYYFSPDRLAYSYDSVKPDLESPLFVRGVFDIGSEPFHFPATAQT